VFHTLTYLLHPEPGALEVVLSADEHDDYQWLSPSDALELPSVWHVKQTFQSLLD
jgi:8-oxo-dGTP pyrophosphatase MutT (NUDIX family)